MHTHAEPDAASIMSRPVKTLRMKESIRDAARLFMDAAISAAVVLDQDDRPVGVVTKTDVVRYELARDGITRAFGRRPEDGLLPAGFQPVDEEEMVERWMTPAIFMVARHTPLTFVARQMVKYGTHHVLVKGPTNEVEGIVSSFDVLRSLALMPQRAGAPT